MDVRRVFQEYGTDITQARMLVECNLCFNRCFNRKRWYINRRYLLGWELINEITGRKSTQKGIIKGINQKERLQTWYTYFQGLLGRPEIEEDEPITQVLLPLKIKRGPFDINEYKREKDIIKEGKSCGLMKYAQKF